MFRSNAKCGWSSSATRTRRTTHTYGIQMSVKTQQRATSVSAMTSTTKEATTASLSSASPTRVTLRDLTLRVSPDNVHVIAPGLVHVRGGLSQQQQVDLCEWAMSDAVGSHPDTGFWLHTPDGSRLLNSAVTRGRMYEALDSGVFPDPDRMRQLCKDIVSLAQTQDPTMPDADPTHLLLLRYEGDEGMYMHQDSGANDGDGDAPVVSMSLGNTAHFAYKLCGRPETVVELQSGDLLLFGGGNRMLSHGVKRVVPHSAPKWLPACVSGNDDGVSARLNFTWRTAPSVLGREHLFKEMVEVDVNDVDTRATMLLAAQERRQRLEDEHEQMEQACKEVVDADVKA